MRWSRGEKTCQPGFDTIWLFQSFEGRRFKGDFDEKPDGFGALARARSPSPSRHVMALPYYFF